MAPGDRTGGVSGTYKKKIYRQKSVNLFKSVQQLFQLDVLEVYYDYTIMIIIYRHSSSIAGLFVAG